MVRDRHAGQAIDYVPAGAAEADALIHQIEALGLYAWVADGRLATMGKGQWTASTGSGPVNNCQIGGASARLTLLKTSSETIRKGIKSGGLAVVESGKHIDTADTSHGVVALIMLVLGLLIVLFPKESLYADPHYTEEPDMISVAYQRVLLAAS